MLDGEKKEVWEKNFLMPRVVARARQIADNIKSTGKKMLELIGL
jgi:hypothetical protein